MRWGQATGPMIAHTGAPLSTGVVVQLLVTTSSVTPPPPPPPQLGRADGTADGWTVVDSARVYSSGTTFSLRRGTWDVGDTYFFARIFNAPSSGGYGSPLIPNPTASGGLWYADMPVQRLADFESGFTRDYKFTVATSDWAYVALDPMQDSNGNGLPDYWNWKYFNNPTNALPDADDDGDGYKNWQEYVAMTDPTDSNSFLRVDVPGRDNGSIQLQWFAYSNRIYRIERADLIGPNHPMYLPLWTNIAVGNNGLFTTNAPLTAMPGAYRLVVEYPPSD